MAKVSVWLLVRTIYSPAYRSICNKPNMSQKFYFLFCFVGGGGSGCGILFCFCLIICFSTAEMYKVNLSLLLACA